MTSTTAAKGVLIGVPTYAGHAYCRRAFTTRLAQLAGPGGPDTLIAWDGGGLADYDDHKVVHCHVNEGETGAELLARKQDTLRRSALDSGHSHLLLLESDILPPTDIIARLLAADAAIVTALYFVTAREEMLAPVTEEQRRELKARGAPDIGAVLRVRERQVPCIYTLRRSETGDKQIARLWSMDDWLQARLAGHSRVRIARSGLGCALIRRDVLEQVPFRLPPGFGTLFSDYYFYRDAFRAGFSAMADLECIALHLHPPAIDAHHRERWFTPRPGSTG